jgi:phosphatidylethanolamine/phosphatidyl-N-methylethanolamine N-methyltransferase
MPTLPQEQRHNAVSESFKRLNPLRSFGTGPMRQAVAKARAVEPSLAERLWFLCTFLRRPVRIGAVAPSSCWLAEAVLGGCDLQHADTVVELGPGTGAFTELILRRIGRSTTFFALELAPEHVRNLRRRFPELVVYNDSAEAIAYYLALHGKTKADCIISGLPWANMLPKLQDRIANAVFGCLAADGVFTAFAYVHASGLPTARHFRHRLRQRFAQVEISPIIWRNLPPAFVYRCRQPIQAGPGISPATCAASEHPPAAELGNRSGSA